MCIIMLNCHQIIVRDTYHPVFYRQENQGTERVRILPKATKWWSWDLNPGCQLGVRASNHYVMLE